VSHTKGSEEVGRGWACPHCKVPQAAGSAQKKGHNEESRLSNERTSSLGMGSLPLTERKIACWGSGKTFQMNDSPWYVASTQRCDKTGNGALIPGGFLRSQGPVGREGNALEFTVCKGSCTLSCYSYKIPVGGRSLACCTDESNSELMLHVR